MRDIMLDIQNLDAAASSSSSSSNSAADKTRFRRQKTQVVYGTKINVNTNKSSQFGGSFSNGFRIVLDTNTTRISLQLPNQIAYWTWVRAIRAYHYWSQHPEGGNVAMFGVRPVDSFVAPLQVSVDGQPPARKTGWLTKFSTGLITLRAKRWVVLEGGKLTYYEQPSELPPYGVSEKGSVLLNDMVVTTKTENPKMSENHILLDAPGVNRDLLLEASDSSTFQSWKREIQQHVTYYALSDDYAKYITV